MPGFLSQTESDGAASRPDVGDQRGCRARILGRFPKRSDLEPVDHSVHQFLGFRPRDQDRGSQLELETAEIAATDDVGNRLVPASPADQLPVVVHLANGQGTVVQGVEMDPVHPQDFAEQQLSVQAGRRGTFVPQISGRRLNDPGDGPLIHGRARNGTRSDLRGGKLLGALVSLKGLSELVEVPL